MNRKKTLNILVVLFYIIFVFSCLTKEGWKTEKEKNLLLREAYESCDYDQALRFLKLGATYDNDQALYYVKFGTDGEIALSESKIPLLFDIYLKLEKGDNTVVNLFNYYLEHRKECFEEEIEFLYKGHTRGWQTIGSYIANFGRLEILKRLANNKININSKKTRAENTALFNVACRWEDFPGYKIMILGPVDGREKLERLNILLDAGADVTLRLDGSNGTIFHYFSWWPVNEDFEGVLNRFIEKGADIAVKDNEDRSAIYYAIYPRASFTDYEAYITYLLKHGLEATNEDNNAFSMFYPKNIDDSIEEFNERKEKWKNDIGIQSKLKRLENFLRTHNMNLLLPVSINGYE